MSYRTTPYRVTVNRRPTDYIAGIRPMDDWATASKRGTIRLALLIVALFAAGVVVAVEMGLAG